MKKILVIAALSIIPTFGFAAKLDTQNSVIKWVGAKVVGKHNGTVKLKEGDVTFEKDMPSAGSFIIDLTTIHNEDLTNAEYNKKLVDHLKSEDFFNVGKFPTAEFKIKKAEKKGKTVLVTGDLTIKGITKPVSFPAQVSKNKNGYSAKGKFKINRLNWDIKYNSGKFFDPKALGDKMIYDDIEIEIDLKTTGA